MKSNRPKDSVRDGPGVHTLIFVLLSILLAGCAGPGGKHLSAMNVTGESLVLTGTTPANLAFDGIVKGSVKMRRGYDSGESFAEGTDFVVDYEHGTIRRTETSRIPDYTSYPLFGLKDFDHSKFKDFSNTKWFVWVDYRTRHGAPWAEPNHQFKSMSRVRRKLEAGGPFKILSYGDSITAGGDASRPDLRFQRRYAEYLQRKFPRAQISVEDVSIPGYTSQQGFEWFDRKVGPVSKPDLVLVGFGMNDHNRVEVGGNEPAKFTTNLVAIARRIQAEKGADVILFSTFPPNENWKFGSHRMAQYAEATRAAAQDADCAYVDVFSVWKKILTRKDQSSLLANNINHPNDFGHWLYEQAFEAMQF